MLAIVLHTVYDFSVILLNYGLSPSVLEMLLFVVSIVLLLFTMKYKKRSVSVLTENARVLIDTLNDFDYEGVAKIYNNPAVDASTFEASGKTVESLGAFEDYGDVSFASGKTDDGKEFVRVIQIANYESGKLTYTVSFFEDGAVAGFFVKQ